ELLVILRHANILEVLRHAVARDRGIERLGIRKIAAASLSQSALPRQAARDLAGAVSTEVEVDHGIFVADGGQRLPAVVHAHERYDELIGHAAVVRFLYSLYRIHVLPALGLGLDHGIESLQLAVPFLVAVHGVIASADAGDFAGAGLTHFLLQLLDVCRS